MFFDMIVSNTKSKNLVLVSPLKQNLNKIRNWLGAPELIMVPLSRGGVEDTKLVAKDTKKIRGQEQPFRGPTLSRPRTGMLEAKDQGHNAEVISKQKRSLLQNQKKELSSSRGQGHFRGLADFKDKDSKSCLWGLHLCP